MVCGILACSIIFWTIQGLTFLEQSNVAHAWRKEWKVKPESPVYFRSGFSS